jgi:hypothetical protein
MSFSSFSMSWPVLAARISICKRSHTRQPHTPLLTTSIDDV